MLGFLAPVFLAGLAALAVPVLAHLIQRERKEVIFFPSTMFLRRIPYQAVRRQRIRHWLLLLLRCIALLCLVIAFTRPYLDRRAGAAAGVTGKGRDVVILLDRSYSMEYGDRWQRAVTAAKDVIGKLERNDRAAVVYFGDGAQIAGGLTDDKSALRRAVESVRPTAAATRYDVAFRAAKLVFGDTAQPRREVVLISDYQRTGWTKHELPALSAGTKFTAVNLSDTVTANIFVAGVDTRYRNDNGRERVVVVAQLVNRGARPVAKHRVSVDIGGREMQAKAVDLPANGTADVEFDEVPVPAGVTPGVVRIAADSLQRDNVSYFVLARAVPLSVLLVQPPSADSSTSIFLSRALSIGDRPSFKVRTVHSGQLSIDDLRATSLVILNDTPIPDGEFGQRLLNHVKNGGGLLVALGEHSAPETWPAFADQLLPRPSGTPIEPLAKHGEALGWLDWGHAVFELFNAPRSGDFSGVQFLRYWPVTPTAEDRQLARLGDGHAALIERRVGGGRALLWASDLGGLWNNFPLQPVFLPFVRQTATYAIGYRDTRLFGTVGQAVAPAMLYGDDVAAADSAGSAAKQYVVITPSDAQVRFGVPGAPATLEVAEQGLYKLRRASGTPDDRLLAANVDLAESDLSPLSPSAIEAAVAPKAADAKSNVAAVLPQPADMEQQQQVWWYLLAVGALLLGLETVISNRMSRRTS